MWPQMNRRFSINLIPDYNSNKGECSVVQSCLTLCDPMDCEMVKAERELFFHRIVAVKPSQKKFLKGWLRRLNGIEWQLLTLNNGKKIKFKDV